MGLLSLPIKIVLAVAAGLAVLGLALYAADFAVAGTITKRERDPNGVHTVTVGLDLGPDVEQELDEVAWNCVRVGNYVKFHVRSERVLVYEAKGGRVLYDSAQPGVPEACLQGGDGGGGGGGPLPFHVPAPATDSAMNPRPVPGGRMGWS